jgi:hypothetical protein
MTSLQINYLLAINTLMVFSVFFIAIYFMRSYNVLVRVWATNTNADAKREDTVRITVKRRDINKHRRMWRMAGYSVLRSSTERDMTTLVMTKTSNGFSNRLARKIGW